MISIEEHNDKFQSFLKITKLYDDMEYYRKVQNLEKDISFFRELISRNSRSNSFNIVPALDGLYKNIYLDSKNIREIQLYLIEGFKRLSLEIDTNKMIGICHQVIDMKSIMEYYFGYTDHKYIYSFINSSYLCDIFDKEYNKVLEIEKRRQERNNKIDSI